MFASDSLRPIRYPYIGQFVGYVTKEKERERESIASRRWHVVRVRPNWESKVAAEMEKLGMGSYIPIEPVKRQRGRLRGMSFVPVFRGYVFAAFDSAGDLWHELRKIKECHGPFLVGGHPIALEKSVMERIRKIEGLLLDYRIVEPMPMDVGATVKIIDYGAFTNLFAPVVEVDAVARRVQVAFHLMGGEFPMWLDLAHVQVL